MVGRAFSRPRKNSRLIVAAAAVVLGAALLADVAFASVVRATQTLSTTGAWSGSWTLVGATECGAQPTAQTSGLFCLHHTVTSALPGLGSVSLSFTAVQDTRGDCDYLLVTDGSLVTRGQGTLRFSGATPGCAGAATNPLITGRVPISVSSGDGNLAGSTGTGALTIGRYLRVQTGCCGDSEGELTLALDAPNATLDVTPPVLAGEASKSVRAPKNAKRVRVRYSVTATDAVDGPLPVACRPRSGSWFRLGRTKVTCSATDSSANTATARFTVTVKRAR